MNTTELNQVAEEMFLDTDGMTKAELEFYASKYWVIEGMFIESGNTTMAAAAHETAFSYWTAAQTAAN
jgi:hypothetical protein